MIFHLRSFAIISALTVPISAQAQIPVTITSDIPATLNQVQTMAQWTQQIAGMKQQYDQMQTDYQQMVRQYESTTGSRDLGQIMNDPKLKNYLPNDWQDVYDSVKKSGYSGLSGSAKSIYENNQAYDGCAHIVSELERTSCEARSVKGAQDKGFALEAYGAAQARMGQIDQLMAEINNTQDPKAIAELQSRISVEQANIQNEQTKLQMYGMVAAAEDSLQQQRQSELNAKSNARRGWVRPQAVQLNSRGE